MPLIGRNRDGLLRDEDGEETRLVKIQRNAVDIDAGDDTILPRIPEFTTHESHMTIPCKHPKVRVVAREEDAEFVECQECGEVFDSNEFRDMEIEETPEDDEEG